MISCRRCLQLQNLLTTRGFCSQMLYTRETVPKKCAIVPTHARNLASSQAFYHGSMIPSSQGKHQLTEDVYLEALTEEIAHEAEMEPYPYEIAECSQPVIELEGVSSSLPTPYKKQRPRETIQACEQLKKKEQENTKLVGEKKRETHLRHVLKSYVSICLQQNLSYKAMMALHRHHISPKIDKSSEVYDAFLKGAAARYDWSMIRDVIKLMEDGQVPLSVHSFSACFVCLGWRAQKERGLEPHAENLVKKMGICGLKVDDLFLKCRYTGNDRNLALQGVRLALPKFQILVPEPSLTYDSVVLNSLNNNHVDVDIKSPAHNLNFSSKKLAEFANEQYRAEMNSSVKIRSISNACVDDKIASEADHLAQQWEKTIREGVKLQLEASKRHFESVKPKTLHIYPYLSVLDVEDYVKLLVQEVRALTRTSEVFSPPTYVLYKDFGRKVMTQARLRRKRDNGVMDKFKSIYGEYCQWYLEPTVVEKGQKKLYNPRQMWQHLLHKNRLRGPDVDVEEHTWPVDVLSGVGEFFYNILLSRLKISKPGKGAKDSDETPDIAAFYVVYRSKGCKSTKEIKPHPSLLAYNQEIRLRDLYFDATLIPMLSPPLPWHSVQHGGYLVSNVPLIRLPDYCTKHHERLESCPTQHLYASMDSLNALSSIPWRVNTVLLDLVIEIFNAGGSKEFQVPLRPAEHPALSALQSPDPSVFAKKSSSRAEQTAQLKLRNELYSQWCDTLYRLSLANHFRNRIFWLPHNMDFRGRVYPCPPHLTHLSNDMARSLLMFAQGKPLGPDGLNWLKLHAVNLTGKKKRASVSERLLYADEMLPEIIDSARNPLTGRKWWLTSDEPWQTLAACMEIAAAMQCSNPATFVSHLPIHQDGSCNGLQHYAALGRDTVGAVSVNLAPSEAPQDVYSNVAALVERERLKDAENGNKIALMLAGHVHRKTIKQTVMTTVYGVTRYGAKLQIVKQLKEIPEISPQHHALCAAYLAEKTFLSLQEMFSSAKEIQDWLTESAKLISSLVGEHVEWVTPLGLPVVQQYEKRPYDHFSKPNVMKQRNAFPPNFIHSLDSSHMMLTSLWCQRNGITFASVHDCFWTHACTVNPMNKICREQFVSLHSQPILEHLSQFMIVQFSFSPNQMVEGDTSKNGVLKRRLNHLLSQVPRRGDFDLKAVLDSVYFFS